MLLTTIRRRLPNSIACLSLIFFVWVPGASHAQNKEVPETVPTGTSTPSEPAPKVDTGQQKTRIEKNRKTPAQKKLVRRISKALENEKYPKAIRLMEELYKTYPKVSVLYNMAVAHHKQKSPCTEVVGAFERFFEACKDCDQEKKAKTRFATVQPRCGPTRLQVKSEGRTMTLSVDGKLVGPTPTQVNLPPGEHVLKLSTEGGNDLIQTLTLAPNTRMNLTFNGPPAVKTAAVSGMNAMEQVGWWAMGLGTLALGVGGAFAYLESEEKSKANEDLAVAWEAKGFGNLGTELEYEALAIAHQEKADGHRLVAISALGGGALLLVSGAALALQGRSQQRTALHAMSLRPTVGGLAIGGQL